MKKIFDYWIPDCDEHFERLIKKRIRNGGPAEYQDDVRSAAYKHVKDFSVAIDVVANIGFWTKPLSVKFKKIFAFEPVQNVFDCLKKNTENLNIVYHQFVVSDRESYVDMIVDTVNTGNNIVDTNSFDTGKIYVNKLDNMNLPKFGLIKVDCQGHDYFVLAGAKETLQKYKPIIVVEQEDDTAHNCDKLLQNIGAYKICNVRKDYIYGWSQ